MTKKKLIIKLNGYEDNFNGANFEILGMRGSGIKVLSEIDITSSPEILEEFPVLKVGYNIDGTKKDIIQLLQDREQLLKEQPKEKINELYGVVINEKFFNHEEGISTEGELLALDRWIEETGTEDEFVYDLVRFRLDRSELTEEEKDDFINAQKLKASKVRKLREDEQQEKQPEKEESIKDEVRDEFEENDKEKEQLWINRMQLCYSKSTQIENYKGKQADVIREISEQLRNRDQKEIDEYMGK